MMANSLDKCGNDKRDRLEVVKLLTALSYCVGGSTVFHIFCVPALVVGSLSLLSDACQRRNLESGLGWYGLGSG